MLPTASIVLAIALLPTAEPGFGGVEDDSADSLRPAFSAQEFLQKRQELPEQRAIRQRIAKDRVKTKLLQKEETSVLRAFRRLEANLRSKEQRLAELKRRGDKLEKRVAELDGDLTKNEAELARLRNQAGRRLLAMHRLARTRLEDLIEGAASDLESRRIREWLRFVLAHDAGLFKSARVATAAERKLKQELLEERADLETARVLLESETGEALQLREDQAALLEAVRTERRASERLTKELVEQARRAERETGIVHGLGPQPEAVPGGFAAQKGNLPWPVAGQVEVPFGKKVDPASGMVVLQRGIDLRSSLSEPVRAVFSGKVVYAARLRGYGNLLIVSHDGWYSIYAHLSSFRVPVGAEVQQHEVIGFVGDTDSSKGAYLYFEIRRRREPVDPQAWLSR